ncbi:hypothetical protein D3C75_1113510 [compost metagenome]
MFVSLSLCRRLLGNALYGVPGASASDDPQPPGVWRIQANFPNAANVERLQGYDIDYACWCGAEHPPAGYFRLSPVQTGFEGAECHSGAYRVHHVL